MTKKTRVTIENPDGAQAVEDDPFLNPAKNGVPHDDPAIQAGPHTECAHCGQGLPTGAIPGVWFHPIGQGRFECEACYVPSEGQEITTGPARKPGRPRGSKTRRTNLDHVVYNCDGQHAEGTIIDRSDPTYIVVNNGMALVSLLKAEEGAGWVYSDVMKESRRLGAEIKLSPAKVKIVPPDSLRPYTRPAPPVPRARARKPREQTPLDFDPTDRAELTIRETDLCLADALRFVASSRQPWDRPAESLARTLMLSAGYRLRKLHGEGVG